MKKTVYAVDALREIRNNTILLVLANKYLNKEVYLKKIGEEIEKHVLMLQKDIASLKNEFPGRFKDETDTDLIIVKFNGIIKKLLNPEKETFKKCADGELGRKMESCLKAAGKAVNEIKARVYGDGVTYTKKDSVSALFRWLGGICSSAGNLFVTVIKIFAGLLLIAFIGFVYLFFTMEREGPYEKMIEENIALINEQRGKISETEKKRLELTEELRFIEEKTMKRADRITRLDLDVEIQKLNQDQRNAMAMIEGYESVIKKNREKIEEIKNKPFKMRLLRQ